MHPLSALALGQKIRRRGLWDLAVSVRYGNIIKTQHRAKAKTEVSIIKHKAKQYTAYLYCTCSTPKVYGSANAQVQYGY
jgi:hypothetical protein